MRITILILATAITALPVVAAEDVRSTISDQKAVSVTIYNQDLALVREQRRLTLPDGEVSLSLRDVSGRLQPETAQLRNPKHPGSIRMIEQNFDFDLLTPQALLQKYVGRTVRVVTRHPTTGEERSETAEVLSATQGPVLRIGDRIETGLPGRIVYDQVPANLRDRPTLSALIENQNAGEHDLELSYLTGGLSWRADYVATLSDNAEDLALNGLVTLTNQSSASYRDARLQLVAGDVHRVHAGRRDLQAFSKAVAMPEAAAEVSRQALFEYHLYRLPRTTTIAENQTKQVDLLSAPKVRARKELVLNGSEYYYTSHVGELGKKMKVAVFVEIANRTADGLGKPLPAGIVRVYKNDKAGSAIFVGEDRIDHTPENEKLRLRLGDAFDVTADKVQTDFRVLPRGQKYKHGFESAYRVVLRNAKDAAVRVEVIEPMPHNWEIVEQSSPHRKAAANTAVWSITVPAGGDAVLTYRARVRY